jgi:hypothetical protein
LNYLKFNFDDSLPVTVTVLLEEIAIDRAWYGCGGSGPREEIAKVFSPHCAASVVVFDENRVEATGDDTNWIERCIPVSGTFFGGHEAAVDEDGTASRRLQRSDGTREPRV